MKIVLALFLVVIAYDGVDASVANLLADRALKKLTTWINSEGSAWLTLPSYYNKGQTQSGNGEFTLAFAGPKLGKIDAIIRSGDAQLTEGDPDPSYDTSQTLKFAASFRNITVNYDHVSFNDYGFFNLTSRATSDGVSVEIAIDLKGHGDTCMAFTNSMDVSYNGSLSVTVMNSTSKHLEMTPVLDAVETHFKNIVIPKAIGTLMKSAAFKSLEYYDVCTGVYYPPTPPNVLADSVLTLTSNALRKNISHWATLPAFSKPGVVNDTTFDVIKVGPGNFSSFGRVRRVGPASYENEVNPKFMNLKVSIEVSNLTAIYGNIEYLDYIIWFPIAETVTAPKIKTTLTITFTRKTPNSIPSCVDGIVSVESQYVPDGEDLKFTNLSPGVPHYAVRSANEVLGPGFIETVEAAVSDLFANATKFALTELCS